jgi:hypothetical protein
MTTAPTAANLSTVMQEKAPTRTTRWTTWSPLSSTQVPTPTPKGKLLATAPLNNGGISCQLRASFQLELRGSRIAFHRPYLVMVQISIPVPHWPACPPARLPARPVALFLPTTHPFPQSLHSSAADIRNAGEPKLRCSPRRQQTSSSSASSSASASPLSSRSFSSQVAVALAMLHQPWLLRRQW